MKNGIIAILVIVGLIGAFIGGTSFSGLNSGDNDDSIKYHNQVEDMLEALVEVYQSNLSRGVTNAASALSNDRMFVLAYFVDQDLSNQAVSGAAKQYGELLSLDGFEVIGESTPISTYGKLPVGELAADFMTRFIKDELGSVWLGSTSTTSSELTVRGWIKIDIARLNALSTTTKSNLMILEGSSLLLSTIPNVTNINSLSDSVLIVDSVEMPIISLSLSDSLILFSLTSEER